MFIFSIFSVLVMNNERSENDTSEKMKIWNKTSVFLYFHFFEKM